MKNKILPFAGLLLVAVLGFFYLSYDGNKQQQTELTDPASAQEFRSLDYLKQASLIKTYALENPVSAWQYLKSVFLVNGQQIGNAHEFADLVGAENISKEHILEALQYRPRVES